MQTSLIVVLVYSTPITLAYYLRLLASSRYRDYDHDGSSRQVAMGFSGKSAQVMGNREAILRQLDKGSMAIAKVRRLLWPFSMIGSR